MKKANQRSDGQNIAGPLLHSEVSDGAGKHPARLTEGFLMMSLIASHTSLGMHWEERGSPLTKSLIAPDTSLGMHWEERGSPF